MTFIPTTPQGWASAVTIVVLGTFSIISLIDKNLRKKRKDENQTDDRVISLLKTNVEILEKNVLKLTDQQHASELKITALEAENEVMKKIFQGRDVQTLEFQKRGFEAFEAIKGMNEHMVKLYNLIAKHVEII